MAQPTIYADIDCDGQVEVKVNNDTGYACNIITSTGVNESIPSTGTNVIRNYNLTSSDWVKVVAAQDATIAANKLTGTIKYITSVTTTTAAPTTTTTTTPAGGGGSLPAGGVDCDNTQTWPALTTKYQVTFTTSGFAASEEWFEQTGASTKKLYMSVVGDPTTAIGGSVRIGMATDGTPPCFADVMTTKNGSDMLLGVLLTGAASGKFYIKAQTAGAVGTWDIWLE